jgi:hypothetical protein
MDSLRRQAGPHLEYNMSESLVLFMLLFVGLWASVEGGAILYRQYKESRDG